MSSNKFQLKDNTNEKLVSDFRLMANYRILGCTLKYYLEHRMIIKKAFNYVYNILSILKTILS